MVAVGGQVYFTIFVQLFIIFVHLSIPSVLLLSIPFSHLWIKILVRAFIKVFAGTDCLLSLQFACWLFIVFVEDPQLL